MIYVVTCEETINEGRYPFGYFNSREEAQERVDFEQARDQRDDKHKNYAIYEIPDLTGTIDYTSLEYQYSFKIILARELLPPHNYKIKVSEAQVAFRDRLSLRIEYVEHVIIFYMTLFENNPDEAEGIVKLIADEIFDLNAQTSSYSNNAIKAININSECGGYADLISHYVDKYKAENRDQIV